MNKKRLIVIALLAVAAGAALSLRLRGNHDERDPVYAGYGEGELVYVSSPIGGELEQLSVARGDQVARDAVLFTLERDQEKAARDEAAENLRASNTQLDKANLDFGRARSLREKRVNTPEDFDTAQQAMIVAQHNAAARRHNLEQAIWRFDQKQQTSPAGALVYDTYFRPGEWVPAGAPILALLPPEYMKVRFFVPEKDLGKFQPGTPIEVHMDGLARPLPAKVSFVSPQAEYTLPIIYSRENRNKLVFLVEGSLAPEDARKLHPGAPVEVRLTSSSPSHGP